MQLALFNTQITGFNPKPGIKNFTRKNYRCQGIKGLQLSLPKIIKQTNDCSSESNTVALTQNDCSSESNTVPLTQNDCSSESNTVALTQNDCSSESNIVALKNDIPFACNYKPLPEDTQIKLLKEAQNGNTKAMEAIQLSNSRLIFKLAHQIGGRYYSQDLFQDLFCGNPSKYSKIILNFNLQLKFKFSTYLAYCVRKYFLTLINKKYNNKNIQTKSRDEDNDNDNDNEYISISIDGKSIYGKSIDLETKITLSNAFKKLDPDEKNIILIKIKEHPVYRKLQEAVSQNVYTWDQIKKIKKSALNKLRIYMQDKGDNNN